MSRPVIGIPARQWLHAAERDRFQTVTIGLDRAYTESVVRAGGAPVLLPRTADLDALAAMMERIDGLLLAGGGDVVSLAFGEEPHPSNLYQDAVLDAMEFAAARTAVGGGMPLLAICRGIQTLNVALGGTLVQDIPSEVPGAVQHHARPRDVVLVHTMDAEPGSLLARVLGTTGLAVNSYHHQAVGRVADGLRATGRARDGVVEGLESDDGRPVLAVQCHPEETSERHPVFRKLFEWLVQEAGRRRGESAAGPAAPAAHPEEGRA